MDCCFSGRPVPIDKLFVLYYPPAAVHETWDRSFLAAARAGEAVRATLGHLERFFKRHVLGRDLVPAIALLAAGTAVIAGWLVMGLGRWAEMGFASRYVLPIAGSALLLLGKGKMRAMLHRLRIWRAECRDQVSEELEAIREIAAGLSEDPDAEDAAAVMRRPCPDALSAIAFYGNNFKAFTYMDFVLCPELKHPADKAELPQRHSLYRDAYYVGEVVYDNWRMFQRDRRLMMDPRFVGSGGRRGVI